MPLAESSGPVALFFEYLGDSEVIWLEDRSVVGLGDPVKPAPMMLTRKQRETAWRTNARRAMPIGEGHATRCQSIYVRGLDLGFRIPIRNVAHPHVIGIEDNNVGVGTSKDRCPNH